MRIISGSFRGKKIHEPKDIKTRPLKDLAKGRPFEKDFENAAVTIFTATWCGYCKGAKQLLNEKNITFFEVDVEDYNISKRKLKEIGIEDFFVPQIFVDGVPIGGFSDLKKIFGSDMPVPEVS